MAVAAGEDFTVAVAEDGSVFSFGINDYGELCTGNTDGSRAPMRVAGLPAGVMQVAAGYAHTGIVTEAGDLLMCGYGAYGQLGLGDEADRTTPTMVARALFGGEAVLMVACGYAHTAAVTEGGGVYTFGGGDFGQLGHGDEQEHLLPMRVPASRFNGERVVMVAAGGGHTVALSEAGHVFTWGQGWRGKLGHNNETTVMAPLQVDARGFGGRDVVFVAAGQNHTAAVTSEGLLFTWGHGAFGRLGHGDTHHRLVPTVVRRPAGRVVMVACGWAHTLVVAHDGALWACGNGFPARLGLNDRGDRHVFERVRVEAFGCARFVVAAAGRYHSAAVTEDGALWTWGDGHEGQLGLGDVEDRLVPARVTEATRIGRCHLLPEDLVLAFTMGIHDRLGAASPVGTLAGKSELVSMIAMAGNKWVSGAAGKSEGLIRLLGGVSADRRGRYVQKVTHDSFVTNRQPRYCRKCEVPN